MGYGWRQNKYYSDHWTLRISGQPCCLTAAGFPVQSWARVTVRVGFVLKKKQKTTTIKSPKTCYSKLPQGTNECEWVWDPVMELGSHKWCFLIILGKAADSLQPWQPLKMTKWKLAACSKHKGYFCLRIF